jgi:hypothetical protein
MSETAQEQALAQRADELRRQLSGRDPESLAALTGTLLKEGAFHFALLGRALRLALPEFYVVDTGGAALPTFQQALVLYYFVTADGTPLAGRWVSFADLPGGRMYAPAFQGYSGNELVRAFGADVEAFRRACLASGGSPLEIAEAAYSFQALPRLPLAVTYWVGDDEFPSASKILFDASACHYLPIDACAILGGLLARTLQKRKN